MLTILAALALLSGAEPVLDAQGLRRLATTLAKAPTAPADPVRFRFDLPLVSDRKTDLAALQNPAGWSYDKATGVFTIDVDFGAVTPDNYRGFDRQGLAKAPPLRMFFFDTRATRDTTFHQVTDARGDTSSTQGWRVVSESYGLAVATSAKAYGTRGGDLPDDFILPFKVKFKLAPQLAPAAAKSLRLRVEGELRTIGGRSILCSDSTGDGYAVDQFTQSTPNVIVDYMCLAPAVLTKVSIVRNSGGVALKEWTRSAVERTEETAETAVIMAGDRNRAQKPILEEPLASSPSASAPLPARH